MIFGFDSFTDVIEFQIIVNRLREQISANEKLLSIVGYLFIRFKGNSNILNFLLSFILFGFNSNLLFSPCNYAVSVSAECFTQLLKCAKFANGFS